MDKPDKMTRVWVLLASLASLALVAFVDYITGWEQHLDVFYFIPVSICAWHLLKREVLLMAVLGAVAWGYVDIHSGHHYSDLTYWYWNIFIIFSSLLILGLVMQRLRANLKEQRRARQELERVLADLRQSAVEIEKLQSHLQVVCAWTQRINIEGRWMTFEEFLQEHLHVKLSHGISPEAMIKLVKEYEEKNKAKPT